MPGIFLTPLGDPQARLPCGDACLAATQEFLLARLANEHTRRSYARACAEFAAWCARHQLELEAVSATHIAAWARQLQRERAPATVATRVAALRRWYDWLRECRVVPANPATSTRTPRPSRQAGSTPTLAPEEIASLYRDFGRGAGELRDRALIGLLLYGFLRIGCALALRAEDLELAAERPRVRVTEKGGVQRWLPLHASVRADLLAYLDEVRFEPRQHLFVAFPRGGRLRSERPLRREQVYAMVRRRLARAGIARTAGCHAFRATGITRFLSQGGRIETAAWLAGHVSLRTTQLYDRRDHDDAGAELSRLAFEREIGGPPAGR